MVAEPINVRLELADECFDELITELDGEFYWTEDLSGCADCDLLTANPSDLDDDGLCEPCAKEGREVTAGHRQAVADYRASGSLTPPITALRRLLYGATPNFQ